MFHFFIEIRKNKADLCYFYPTDCGRFFHSMPLWGIYKTNIMRVIEQYLRRNGTKPFDEYHHSYEELYLCFAGAFGITTEDDVHRKAIYNYVQTHHSANSESSLQGSLEKSIYWNRINRAHYRLNESGWDKLQFEFAPNNENILLFPIVVFRTYLGHDLIGVKSYPDERLYELFLNSENVGVKKIYDVFREQGIELPSKGVSKPREVHSWLLKQNYTWEIINFDDITRTPPNKGSNSLMHIL